MIPIPLGIDLDALPGPKRGVSPVIYFRDECIGSPSGRYFALAYSIFEIRMGHEVGRWLWGRIVAGRAEILGNPEILATCWGSPWASWVTDETFVFKAAYSDRKAMHLPLVAVHVNGSFAVVPGTNSLESRPTDPIPPPADFKPLSTPALLRAIAAG